MKIAGVVPLRCDAMSTHRNRLGYRGVEEIRPGRFRATVGRRKGSTVGWRSPYFDTAAEAARAYDAMARKVYGATAYLNFPRAGERQCVQADELFCRHGHSRKLHTAFCRDGRPWCRLCNAEAQARSKARKAAS